MPKKWVVNGGVVSVEGDCHHISYRDVVFAESNAVDGGDREGVQDAPGIIVEYH